MKVGEAGEAFFVFETDNDVPDDLITSPLLEPTQPVSPDPPPAEDFGRFGTRNRSDGFIDNGLGQEPDFLDLNASSTSLSGEVLEPSASSSLASPSDKLITFPSLHPSSSSLPDHPHHTSVSLPQSSVTSDEYSWEWGEFPQRAQTHTHSGTAPTKTARGTEVDELVVSQSGEFQRSKSLPPELERDLTDEVPSISLQSDEQFNERELLSDVETGFDHDLMMDRERGTWARWWRRDNRHSRRAQEASPTHVPTQDECAPDTSLHTLPASSPELCADVPPSFSGGRPKMRYAKTLRLTSEQLVSITKLILSL